MGADPSSYRDEIPHSSLLASAARRVSDGWRLGRIETWLEIAAEEDYGHCGNCRRNRAGRERGCMLQGAPTTPPLSHIYMRHFIVSWKTLELRPVLWRVPCTRAHGSRPGPGGSCPGDGRADHGVPVVAGMACEVRCVRLPEEPIKFLR